MSWTRDTLRQWITDRLQGSRLIVVSNRAPYQFTQGERGWEAQQSVGGMATTLEPVMRACGGTWIAQGDTERPCANGMHLESPRSGRYNLRTVTLNPAVAAGFYSGFSNGALWPLCHTSFIRPRFSAADWECYRIANEIFADAIIEEAGSSPAFVFVQDYHFALLPALLKRRNPNLVIGQFWHIPWPNPEVCSVCPYLPEIVEGMLGCDLLGFQLRRFCENFLSTVDQSVEAVADHVSLTVQRHGHLTQVRPFPISIDAEEHSVRAASKAVAKESLAWSMRLHNPFGHIGIGIDRLDYTKGIPERLQAIESLLLHYPEYRGLFHFVQIGVPSRTSVPEYRRLDTLVRQTVDRINDQWGTPTWRPVTYFNQAFSQTELMGLHLLARFCIVSSLHDGMNLVAKEFVASRNDGKGVLLLSRFAGAATELNGALLFNPYHLDETRESIRAALEMKPAEVRHRMSLMRQSLDDNTVYRWAGKMLSTMARYQTHSTIESEPCASAR
ncbi:MAG: trehalose-6-phosphate synthase [Bryobacteraceae bacterium]